MKRSRSKSMLHLQLGQETIYLIMSISVMAAVYFALQLLHAREQAKRDPPIITLNEADGYTFATGSAGISADFERQLKTQVVPKVLTSGKSANATIIEVVGHTDDVPLKASKRLSANLDTTLMPMLKGVATNEPLAADNVGLGMARAVAVARILNQSNLAASFEIIPMSAGAFLKPDDSAASGLTSGNDANRRRIEIRLRRKMLRTKAP